MKAEIIWNEYKKGSSPNKPGAYLFYYKESTENGRKFFYSKYEPGNEALFPGAPSGSRGPTHWAEIKDPE